MKKLLFILFFVTGLYSQELIVNKTDSDRLFSDIVYMYPSEIKDNTIKILVVFTGTEKYLIINDSFACDWKDVDVFVQEKILRRRELYKPQKK